jgi:predicted ATPase
VGPDRNPLFRDREAELELLPQRLVAERRLDLSGLGGVGKTRLAIEFLHRHHDEPAQDDYPDGVFWLRGETAAALSADLAALAWLPHLLLPERQERERSA